MHHPRAMKRFDDLVPQPVDVEALLGGEIDDRVDDPRFAPHVLAFDQRPLIKKLGAANGTMCRAMDNLLASVALACDHLDDLGDDVAAAQDDHPIPDADVLALDLVEIVQGRPLDRHPLDVHGFDDRDGGDDAAAPHLQDDVTQRRELFDGGEFVRRRPAGVFDRIAQLVLHGNRIDLDHHPIQQHREIVPFNAHLMVKRLDLLRTFA